MLKENNTNITYNKIADILLVLAFFLFTYRGNLGAIMAIGSLMFRMFAKNNLVRNIRLILAMWMGYLVVFAIVLYSIRSLNFEFYVLIAYIFAVFNMIFYRQIDFDYVIKLIYKGSFFYVFSIWLQFIFPSVYSIIAKIFFSSNIYQQITARMSEGYITGFTREVAYVALIVLMGLLYIIFYYDKKFKIPLCLFFVLTLFITGKKAHPILALFVIGLTYYFMTKNLKKHMKILLVCFAIIFTIILLFPIWKNISFMSRIVTFIDGIQKGLDVNALTSGRKVIYDRAWQLWADNKVYGIGWENFRNIGAYGISQYTTWFKNYDIHNCYLQILCENGLIGMGIFVLLIVFSIIMSIRTLRHFNNPSIKYSFCYFAFFLLYAISEPCLFQDSYFIIFFLCIGELAKNDFGKKIYIKY